MAGKGKLQNATLKLPSLAKPVQIQHADLIFNQESTALHNMSLTAGQTNLQGTLTVKSFATPQVQFTLHADKMNVREMQEFFTPPRSESAHDGHEFWPRLSRVEAGAPNESNLLTRITGGGTVTAGAIQYDDLILNDSHSTIALDHGVIRMNPISAEVYGGKQSGNITIDMRPAQPVYSVSLKTEKVDANKLISAVSSLKEILYGSLAANMNGTFSSNSAEAIARSMNGTLELNLTNGKLMNLDLLHALAEVGKFAPLAGKANNFTNVIQLSSTFNVKDGVARISNLQAAIDGGAIAANGLVNLAEQSLDLHVMAVLNKTLSQQVGGIHIVGFMNTALANDQKELVLPIILTGTLQHPQVAPDLQQVAQMKLQNLLPTTSKPNEFTSSMLEGVLPSKTQAETTRTQPTSSPRKVLRARRRSRQQTSRVMAAPAPKN
jgi:AsmA protein